MEGKLPPPLDETLPIVGMYPNILLFIVYYNNMILLYGCVIYDAGHFQRLEGEAHPSKIYSCKIVKLILTQFSTK